MKQSPGSKKLEEVLRSSKIVAGGFMGMDERSVEEIRSILIDHFQETVSYCTDERAIVDMKRVGCWYTGGAPGAKVFREALNRASSLEEMETLIRVTPIV